MFKAHLSNIVLSFSKTRAGYRIESNILTKMRTYTREPTWRPELHQLPFLVLDMHSRVDARLIDMSATAGLCSNIQAIFARSK
jgi:hypothetical protein